MFTLSGAYVASEEAVLVAGAAGPTTFHGDYYRLVTASLAHLSVMHLCGNVVLLWIAGVSLGRVSQSGVLFISFVIAGVCGTAATLVVSGGWVLGASAGVFGMFGALIGQLCRHRGPVGAVQSVILGGVVLVIASLGYGDILAHWCGFFIGLWLGCFAWSQRAAWTGAGLAVFFTILASAYHWAGV